MDVMFYKKKEVTFIVEGEPVPQGRPRFSRRSGGAYDPEKSREAKTLVKAYAAEAASLQKFTKCTRDMPVKVTILAYKGISKSLPLWMKWACKCGWVAPTKKKADADNIIKLVFDAMTGILYEDDAQIVSIVYECRYSDEPRVEVKVEGFYQNIGEIRDRAEAERPKRKKKVLISTDEGIA